MILRSTVLTFAFAAVLASPLILPCRSSAATVVGVSTSAALQQALNTVADGGVIELAAGTYTAPSTAFTIFPQGNAAEARTFTIRAASGANVIINGGGARGLFTITTGKLISFENLNFIGGTANQDAYGSVISMQTAQTSFVNCTFQNNVSTAPTSGGGVRIDTSSAAFQNCSWTNNTATSFGAALVIDKSRVFINNSQFVGNRINVAGHVQFSAGGAIHANASVVQINTTRFENNQAAYVGGAIYAYGPWQDPNSTPTMTLTINDCLFSGNIALKNGGDTFAAPPTGGAVLMEDQSLGRFYNSRFVNNTSKQGGALSSYRTTTEVQNCVFQNNLASGGNSDEGFGGAIVVLSDDNNDVSTANGAINRPSARFTMTDSLIQGSNNNSASARQGGGIFAAGDLHAQNGVGVPQRGTPEINRTTVILRRVAFSGISATDGGNGTGGAVTGSFIDLNADGCIIQKCHTDRFGGGMEFVRDSKATFTNSTFAENSAGPEAQGFGGGILEFGGELYVDSCKFFGNFAATGFGAAIATTEGDANMSGFVRNTVFSNNTGSPTVYDGDQAGNAYVNTMQYDNNQWSFGSDGPFYCDFYGDRTIAQLNVLNVNGTTKSSGGNVELSTPPELGAILMIPTRTRLSGAPGEATPIPAQLVYASSGGTATVDGTAQNASGVLSTTSNGVHTLNVGGTTFTTTPTSGAAVNISTRLRVGGGDDALIAGFFIVGPDPKRVVIRALGPSTGVAGALQDTTLELFRGSTSLATNDNWRSTVTGSLITAPQAVDIVGTSVAPTNDAESAIVATLTPGAYTAVVRGAGGSSGIGVVEVYDLDALQTSTLANISTRGSVQTGDNVLIGGFIYLGGPNASKVVIRGIGPSLAGQVTGPLSDPTLDLVDANGNVVTTNDDWGSSPDAAAISAASLAPSSSKESVIYRTGLPFGFYTAVVRGKNGATGIGVVEAYIFD